MLQLFIGGLYVRFVIKESCVNFMVWCTLLIFSMKVSRALSVSVHTMKISSMNLFHISMALLFNLISLGSSSPMNRLA